MTRTTYERAAAGYDPKFRDTLAREITDVIAHANLVTDANVTAIRIAETCDALALVLVSMMALSPQFDVPSRLREAADELSKKARRDVAKARAEGIGDILGAQRAGHA
jgi:hypothetical protein